MFRILLILAVLASFMSVAAADDDTAATQEVQSGFWFVELKSPPTADGSSLSTVKAEKTAFRSAAKKAGLVYTERYAFNVLWNGLSIKMNSSQLGKLAGIPGVAKVYPVALVSVPEIAEVSDPELTTALGMTGADIAQNTLGFTGAGVKVAVMDTGVDYNHPDLGGCFGPGCRVFTGHDFVGDDFNANPGAASYNPVPVPDNDPDDCGGHGTHVAGIVGANGTTIKGVAPGASLGAYRVFGCEGSTTADIMIAAMERILADDMDVLNMSIGSSFQWPQYPTAQAADRLVNKGVVVVASIGNSGAIYSAGAPGLGKKVIGVASFDNVQFDRPYFTVSPDDTAIPYFQAVAAPNAPTEGSFPMARTGTPTSAADACSALPAGSLDGFVALIRRGTCSFHIKALNAQNAGAEGVVLYNNVSGFLSPTVAGPVPITIPVVLTSDTFGVLINNRIAVGPVTMTWQEGVQTFSNPTGGLISAFSSYGLSPDLDVKPDIGAPGGFILSTFPLELGGYARISGTSMSSPHVAGAAALLLQAKPATNTQSVRDILMNSADPKNWSGNPGLGFLDHVHRQGTGMLDVDDAILATTKIQPGKLVLGESEAGPVTRTISLENNSNADVTYDLSHSPALSTGGSTFAPTFLTGFASVAFSVAGAPVSSILVPAEGSAAVDVTITANPALGDRSQYGGYIVFTPQGGGQPYRVSYAGLKGDYQSIQVIAPADGAYPKVSRLTSCALVRELDCFDPNATYANAGNGSIFTLRTPPAVALPDVPYFRVHLAHQSRQFKIEIFDAVTNVSWGHAVNGQFFPRNSGNTGAAAFFAFSFDGITGSGNKTYTLPDGTYYAVISVLKALGDENNPAHYESWTSTTFVIDRP